MRSDRYLFVSDLHLDASAPEGIAQFIAFLDGEARNAAALYILGDLFEAWVGDDDPEPARDSVCLALHRFTESGTPCFILRGNRDFLLGVGFERRTGCQLLPDPVLLERGSLRVFVSHGDPLCTADHSYQEFRTMVRNPAWQARYLRLPLGTRRALAETARRGSKAHTERQQARIMDVHPDAVAEAFRVSGTTLMIHGHTHRPAVHTVQTELGTARRIVLGDWYGNGSYLVLHADGRHEIIALPQRAAGAPQPDPPSAWSPAAGA
jgi:UDP-2,3-diacylglucosamine hydrolase